MLSTAPNFSPYPFAQLRSLSRAAAALESALARWLTARPLGPALAALAGCPVRARIIGALDGATRFDPHAAHADVRLGGASIVLACAARPLRALAQQLLGGPPELPAPRPLTPAEQALWVLAVAAAIEDVGAPAEVWPADGLPPGSAVARRVRGAVSATAQTVLGVDAASATHIAIELVVEAAPSSSGASVTATMVGGPWTIVAYVPRALEVRVPPPRRLPDWGFDVPVVVARCAIDPEDLARVAVRDVVTVERELSLVIGEGAVGLRAAQQAVEASVVTGYVPRRMSPALADTAAVELTVQLGTTRLTLRELGELAVGAVVPLGRPLAGPFEVRAAGRLIGRGELVDVDGELGVRIVSLEE